MNNMVSFLKDGFNGKSFGATLVAYLVKGMLGGVFALGLYYVTGGTKFLGMIPLVCLLALYLEHRFVIRAMPHKTSLSTSPRDSVDKVTHIASAMSHLKK